MEYVPPYVRYHCNLVKVILVALTISDCREGNHRKIERRQVPFHPIHILHVAGNPRGTGKVILPGNEIKDTGGKMAPHECHGKVAGQREAH